MRPLSYPGRGSRVARAAAVALAGFILFATGPTPIAPAAPAAPAVPAAPAASAVPAAPATGSMPLSAALDAYVKPFVGAGHFAGQVVVSQNGKILMDGTYGLANRELGVPVAPDTRFCIASITKPITIIVATQLIEEGKLAMSDTLGRWIPGFPAGDRITVEHLLRHRAGIPHRLTAESEEAVPRTAADMVELAKKSTLLFEPGSSSTYSSGGYAVLARVLELASGQDYGTLVRGRVFEPLALSHTSNPTAGEILPGRAPSYVPGLHGIGNAPPKDLTFLVGAGSVFSTARDIHTLALAVVNGKMGEGPRQSFVRSGKLNWNGSTNGYRAFADFDSATGLAVAFCGNVHSGANDLVRRAIPAIVRGETPPASGLPALALDPAGGRANVPDATLRSYEGVYMLGNGTRLDVRAREGVLAANEWILVPLSDSTFFSLRDYGEVRPVPGPDHRIVRLDWKVGADVWPAPRIGD